MLATAPPRFLANQPQAEGILFLRDHRGWVQPLEKDQHRGLLLSRTRKRRQQTLWRTSNFLLLMMKAKWWLSSQFQSIWVKSLRSFVSCLYQLSVALWNKSCGIRERWWDWWWWVQGGNLSWIPPRQEVSSLVTFCFSCTLTATIDLSCHTYDVIRLNGVVVLLLPLNRCIVCCKMTYLSLAWVQAYYKLKLYFTISCIVKQKIKKKLAVFRAMICFWMFASLLLHSIDRKRKDRAVWASHSLNPWFLVSLVFLSLSLVVVLYPCPPGSASTALYCINNCVII